MVADIRRLFLYLQMLYHYPDKIFKISKCNHRFNLLLIFLMSGFVLWILKVLLSYGNNEGVLGLLERLNILPFIKYPLWYSINWCLLAFLNCEFVFSKILFLRIIYMRILQKVHENGIKEQLFTDAKTNSKCSFQGIYIFHELSEVHVLFPLNLAVQLF